MEVKKWWLLLGVAIFTLGLVIGGKVYMDNQRAQAEKVEQSFDKILVMHPTINLMNFYDTEEASS
ncbi:tandem-type lipoprotein [Granulicatella seriolae]|uniref:Tandem-type lipoprotein n=1 Tax=Granulicatella seriolae TaxID=2967226 RepID=A0ABT1WNU2_9LACT|nr:tandem-type lipoprotein [Granulicatella seriolae]